jgi:hypothetical protein
MCLYEGENIEDRSLQSAAPCTHGVELQKITALMLHRREGNENQRNPKSHIN